MMRALVMTEAVLQRIQDQVAWANRPENWYRPERDPEPPGDNPAFVLILEHGFRVVYSYTVAKDFHYRQLSISVEGAGYPHPAAIWTIATLFGFTGGAHFMGGGATVRPGSDWHVQTVAAERCVTVTQLVTPAEVAT